MITLTADDPWGRKDHTNPIDEDRTHKVYGKFDALLTSIIREASSEIEPLNRTPDRVAYILSSAMRGFKLVASDSAELRQSMKGQISLTLRTQQD